MPDHPLEGTGDALAALVPPGSSLQDAGVPIRKPIVHVGQGPRNEIVLDDDTVSTRHARIEYTDGAWRVTDLDSRNGTFLDGVRLAAGVPTPLDENTLIGFGAVRLGFVPIDPERADRARAEYVAPPREIRLAERSAFRIPLWLVLFFLVLLTLLLTLYLWYGGEPAQVEPGAPIVIVWEALAGVGDLP